MTAPLDPGEVEVRYVSGSDHAVLARAAVKVLGVEVTLDAPAEATAGSEVKVIWKGPANDGDYLAIVPATAGEAFEAKYCPVEKGRPALVTAPMQPGAAEVRYLSGQRGRVLGRRPITIAAAKIELSAPDEVVAGSTVDVSWKGPNNANDYVTIVPKVAPDSTRGAFGVTGGVTKCQIAAPAEPGHCEIRYVSGQDGAVLGRRALRTVAAEATLTAPGKVMSGSSVSVIWKGPNNENDFITIVAASASTAERGEPVYTRGGSPAALRAPSEPGEMEIRYVGGADGRHPRPPAVEGVRGAGADPSAATRAGGRFSIRDLERPGRRERLPDHRPSRFLRRHCRRARLDAGRLPARGRDAGRAGSLRDPLCRIPRQPRAGAGAAGDRAGRERDPGANGGGGHSACLHLRRRD
jgi:uncharacterized OB-fold protein